MTVQEIWSNANTELVMLREKLNPLYATYCETMRAYERLVKSPNYTNAEKKEAFEKTQTAYAECRPIFNRINLLEEIHETAEKLMDLLEECE